jgi:hypothetical protein
MIDRPADERALHAPIEHVIDQLATRPGAQHEIDLRIARDESGEQRREAERGGGFQRADGELPARDAVVQGCAPGLV